LIRAVQPIEKARQRPGLREVADGVQAAVGAKPATQPRVGVPESPQVELLNPAAGVVEEREPMEQCRSKAARLPETESPPFSKMGEGLRGLLIGPGLSFDLLEPVVGSTTSGRVEERMPQIEGFEQSRERVDGEPRDLSQPIHPGVPGPWVARRQDTVGPERGIHARLRIGPRGQCGVMRQRVDRVIGGTHHGDTEVLEQGLRRETGLGEQRVAPVEDAARGPRIEKLPDAERALELHVGPVVERVAECERDGPRPRLELLPVRCVPRTGSLRDPIRSHGPPLVMVALEPDLGDRAKAVVLCDLCDG
jgi:hypothetical protein